MKKFTFTLLLSFICYGIVLGQSYTFEATSTTPIKLRTNSTDRMIVTSGGLVGIGTNGVRAKLHVYDGSAGALPALLPTGTVSAFENNGDTYLSVLSTNNSKGGVTFGSPSDVEKGWIRYNHNINEMQLGTNSTARFYIKSGGKVGIGTSTPTYNLEVIQDNNSDNGMGMTRFGGDAGSFFGISANGNITTPTATLLNDKMARFGGKGHDGTDFTLGKVKIEMVATQNWTSTANGGKMSFFTTPNGTTASTQQMVIDHDGDVGINKTTPQAKLDIDGDIILGTVDRSWAGAGTTFIALDRQGKSVIRFTGNGVVNLSGIAGGVDGMLIYLYNFQSASFTIFNDDPAAPSQNRILTGNANANIVFGAKGGAILVYDGVTQRWRVLSYNI